MGTMQLFIVVVLYLIATTCVSATGRLQDVGSKYVQTTEFISTVTVTKTEHSTKTVTVAPTLVPANGSATCGDVFYDPDKVGFFFFFFYYYYFLFLSFLSNSFHSSSELTFFPFLLVRVPSQRQQQ